MLRCALSGLDKYHASEEATDSQRIPIYDKEYVGMNDKLFVNRRASTSLIPSQTIQRPTTHFVSNGASPSRRSIQSLRPGSQNGYSLPNNHGNTNGFLVGPNMDAVTSCSCLI